MRKLPLSLLIALLLLGPAGFAQTTLPADDCSWRYAGSSRADVKNRRGPQRGYRIFNRGRPITLSQWYDLVCPFGRLVPEKRDIPESDPIPGIETIRVTLKGYLVAAKFERSEDHDIHAEIGAKRDGTGPHIIVEFPAFPEFCRVRKTLWNMVRKDRLNHGKTGETSEWTFIDRPQVLVTGYVFLDSHHWNSSITRDQLCRDSGGRGDEDNGGNSLVEGLWELHPVTGLSELRIARRRRR